MGIQNRTAHMLTSSTNCATVDLFNEDLPPADIYCVAHLVHMFSEDKSDVILRNVYRALRPGGAILLLEKTLAERRTEPELCTMYSCRLSLGREGVSNDDNTSIV